MPGTCARARPHDAAKLKDVLAAVYRDEVPDLVGITNFEWAVILSRRQPRGDHGRADADGTPMASAANLRTGAALCFHQRRKGDRDGTGIGE